MPDEILRTFIAIELAESLRIALQRVQEKLKFQTPPGSVRWVGPDGIHLTLKFLGDTSRSRVSEIESALQAACAGFERFEFSVEGRGCFPNFRRPRVIWVAVREKSGALLRLQAAIERNVAPLGWPTEERAFSPHLTLGRVSKGADDRMTVAVGQAVEKFVVEQIGQQEVSAVSLMRSDIRPTGAIYSRLSHITLAGATDTGQGG
jgi:2'-5' RNA ligase